MVVIRRSRFIYCCSKKVEQTDFVHILNLLACYIFMHFLHTEGCVRDLFSKAMKYFKVAALDEGQWLAYCTSTDAFLHNDLCACSLSSSQDLVREAT